MKEGAKKLDHYLEQYEGEKLMEWNKLENSKAQTLWDYNNQIQALSIKQAQ
jgi:hypothetical protein